MASIAARTARHAQASWSELSAVKEFREKSTPQPTKKAAERPTRVLLHLAAQDAITFSFRRSRPNVVAIFPSDSCRPDIIASNHESSWCPRQVSTSSAFVIRHAHGVGAASQRAIEIATIAIPTGSSTTTYPWPEPPNRESSMQRSRAAAQDGAGCCAKRYLTKGPTLADLYDPLAMPLHCYKAHRSLDHRRRSLLSPRTVHQRTPAGRIPLRLVRKTDHSAVGRRKEETKP